MLSDVYTDFYADFYADFFTVVPTDVNRVKIIFADSTHAIFKAHFPDNPLVPGFVLMDICEMVFALTIKKLSKAAFLIPIQPNDVVYLSRRNTAKATRIDLHKDDELVAHLTFEVLT